MNGFKFSGIVMLAFLFAMCAGNQNKQATQTVNTEKRFDVMDVLQTSQYTYLQVLEGNEVKWVAVTRQEAKIGDSFYYDNALEMNNFHSNELDRTFEVIYFINQVSRTPLAATPHNHSGNQHSGRVQAEARSGISLSKSPDELTIGQIFANPSAFSGKEITIRGIVVKVNPEIMGTNWIHLQDGTGENGKFDLTITSNDQPQLNSEVTFRGTVVVNKDFGSGYFYDVFVENGSLIKAASKL